MKDRKLLGTIGEDLAESMLFADGYTILARNFTAPCGEIDIICQNEDELCFVEVKTRTCDVFGEPEEAVDDLKQYRIRKTAEYYISTHYDEICGTDGYDAGSGDEITDMGPDVIFKVIEIMIRETDDDYVM